MGRATSVALWQSPRVLAKEEEEEEEKEENREIDTKHAHARCGQCRKSGENHPIQDGFGRCSTNTPGLPLSLSPTSERVRAVLKIYCFFHSSSCVCVCVCVWLQGQQTLVRLCRSPRTCSTHQPTWPPLLAFEAPCCRRIAEEQLLPSDAQTSSVHQRFQVVLSTMFH